MIELVHHGEVWYNVYFSADQREQCCCKEGGPVGCGEFVQNFLSHAGASTFVKCMMRPEFYAAASRHWNGDPPWCGDGGGECGCVFGARDCEYIQVVSLITTGCDERLAVWGYFYADNSKWPPGAVPYLHWLHGKHIKEVIKNGNRPGAMSSDD